MKIKLKVEEIYKLPFTLVWLGAFISSDIVSENSLEVFSFTKYDKEFMQMVVDKLNGCKAIRFDGIFEANEKKDAILYKGKQIMHVEGWPFLKWDFKLNKRKARFIQSELVVKCVEILNLYNSY